jgi:hypothetical protein
LCGKHATGFNITEVFIIPSVFMHTVAAHRSPVSPLSYMSGGYKNRDEITEKQREEKGDEMRQTESKGRICLLD